MTKLPVLNVSLHREVIGTLTYIGADRSLFALSESYIDNPIRPTLSLSFKDALGELITTCKPTQTKLLPFFSNLLPEGNVRTYLAQRADVHPEREFFLLWALGQDLPGAITVTASDGTTPSPVADNISIDQGHHERALRFSLAGVQLKFSALRQARGGLTIPADGSGGDWIVKLPSAVYPGVPENEFSMMTLAYKIGIDVPPIQLIAVADIAHLPSDINQLGNHAFAIQRFDRADDGSSIHIEDFAQVFGVYPHDKYQKASMRNIATVIGSEGQEKDVVEFIRRLVFNTLIGNADMHLKNWSLIYRDKHTASIAPAYDFVSTIAYIADSMAALKVSRSKRFDAFDNDELAHLANKAHLPEKLVLDTAHETVEKFHTVWQQEKHHLALTADIIKIIDQHLKIIPLIKAHTK